MWRVWPYASRVCRQRLGKHLKTQGTTNARCDLNSSSALHHFTCGRPHQACAGPATRSRAHTNQTLSVPSECRSTSWALRSGRSEPGCNERLITCAVRAARLRGASR